MVAPSDRLQQCTVSGASLTLTSDNDVMLQSPVLSVQMMHRHTEHVSVTLASYKYKRTRLYTASETTTQRPTTFYHLAPPTTPSMSEERQTKKRKLTPESDEDLDVPARRERLLIRRHSEKARVPTRGSPLAAGYDLYRLGVRVLDCTVGLKLIHGSARSRKGSQLGGKPSSIPRFQLRFLMAHMDASLHEVVLVSATEQRLSPLLTEDYPPAARFGIDTGAGVIDADYRGIVYILLFNLGDKDFEGLFLCLSTAPSIR